jgi:hypothetical protein
MGTIPAGTSVTPGTNFSEGSYAVIATATSGDHFAFVPSFQVTGDTTTNLRYIQVDMGFGAATEDTLLQNIEFMTTGNEEMAGFSFPIFNDVPAGTRLTFRASNSGTNDGAYNAAIHAVS